MDTMKTPHDKQPAKPADDEIQIFELRFRQPYPDLGLPSMAGGAGILRARDGTKIAYLPKTSLYRVTHATTTPGKVRKIYLPREWAAFEASE